jgi:UDP-N-acetylglucosamine acyltransferase
LSTTKIHPLAIIEKGAELGSGVVVGPYAIIGSKVTLGDQVEVAAHAMVSGRTTIGARTRIWPFAHIGNEPQDKKFKGEDTELVCGEDNIFREYVNINIGTEGGGGKTQIGSRNLLMVNTHVAHDCILGDECTIANGVSLAGHVEVDDKAVIGGHVAIHQFVKLGSLSMLAGGAIVVQDVLPFAMVQGDRARPIGINKVGVTRAGYSKEDAELIKELYKIIYHEKLTLDEAKTKIRDQYPQAGIPQIYLNFLQRSTRGLCR